MSPQIYRRGKHTGERDLRDLQTEERITERKAARQAREASGSRRVQGRWAGGRAAPVGGEGAEGARQRKLSQAWAAARTAAVATPGLDADRQPAGVRHFGP